MRAERLGQGGLDGIGVGDGDDGLARMGGDETAEGRKMLVYSDLLGKAIRSMIAVKEEKDLDSLFTGGKTTALTNTISGLDDFELITFLVIQEAG